MNFDEIMSRFFSKMNKVDKLDSKTKISMARKYKGKITNATISLYFGITPDAIVKQKTKGIVPFKKIVTACIENDLDINYIFCGDKEYLECNYLLEQESKKEVDKCLDRLIANMITGKIIEEAPTNNQEKSNLIGNTYRSLITHRSRGTVPYKDLVVTAMEYSLDMNYIFKR